MHIHILGICGTFMGSLALLARDLGHTVTGSDANVYPPMSTQLEQAGIEIMQGYQASHLQPAPDLVVVGNAMKRGIEAVEYMLNEHLPYTSGPQFLSEHVLQHRKVLAVAGTHGKTTTTTMLAWILHYAKLDAGFLIGGVPLQPDAPFSSDGNDAAAQLSPSPFARSSYLGQTYFVIEADEYDSAFFDKRSKFVHYRPTVAILNNLEFDHADIFADLEAIQTQFHHMIRMIPSNGRIIMPAQTPSLEDTLKKGAWTPVQRTQIKADSSALPSTESEIPWTARLDAADGTAFTVNYQGNQARVTWSMSGLHNVSNGLAAIAAAYQVGMDVTIACEALSCFAGIKRRMEHIGTVNQIDVYDDFAHHPTAIETTLEGARRHFGQRRIWAVIEPRSNTMQMGHHRDLLAQSTQKADYCLWYQPPSLDWSLEQSLPDDSHHVFDTTQSIINYLLGHTQPEDVIVIMSNGSFEGLHTRLMSALNK